MKYFYEILEVITSIPFDLFQRNAISYNNWNILKLYYYIMLYWQVLKSVNSSDNLFVWNILIISTIRTLIVRCAHAKIISKWPKPIWETNPTINSCILTWIRYLSNKSRSYYSYICFFCFGSFFNVRLGWMKNVELWQYQFNIL